MQSSGRHQMAHVVGLEVQPVFKFLCLSRVVTMGNHSWRVDVTIGVKEDAVTVDWMFY